jgi:hypothetical protein
VDLGDAEGTAEWAYRLAGLEPDEPASPMIVGRALVGQQFVVLLEHGLVRDAALCRRSGRWTIVLRHRLSPSRRRWLVWHELAEWILLTQRHHGERIEHTANLLAACLRVPRRAALKAGSVEALERLWGLDRVGAERRMREVQSVASDW